MTGQQKPDEQTPRQMTEERREQIQAWLEQRREEQAGTFVTPGFDLSAA